MRGGLELNLLLDKLVLLLCCLIPALQPVNMLSVVTMLTGLTLSALSSYLSSRTFTLVGGGAYLFLCLVRPEFCYFLPLVVYDMFSYLKLWQTPLLIVPLFFHFAAVEWADMVIAAALTVISLLLQRRTTLLQKTRRDFYQLRDSSRELSLRMESKNRELMDKQDYEVRLATLNERNRIAREIHDNVGHMLSRSLLQVGALMAVESDQHKKEGLSSVRDTLSAAMDSIRNSVHDLHDESLDLHLQLTAITREFRFCPLRFDYDVTTPLDAGMIYAVVAIVREALSNIIRHSGATQAELLFREHPAFFQLIVKDNGRGSAALSSGGIGLHSMKERVDALHGHLSIKGSHGFQLFITLPKGGEPT